MKLPSLQSQLIEHAPGYVRTPFTILVDTAEKHPWSFDAIRSRSYVDKEMRLYAPQVQRQYIGIGLGDYSLADATNDYRGRVAIERKSLKDFQGTLLGWARPPEESDDDGDSEGGWITAGAPDRRARFKRELANLAAMECKAIVVEASIGEILDNAPTWGSRMPDEQQKYIHATWIAWQQEFPGVPWMFCDSRRLAEITAFRILEQWWSREQRHRRQRVKGLVDAK